MLRKTFSRPMPGPPRGFHPRGHEVKRIETFSDAVFAFAVTLLIVSLEVPKSFDELLITMRGFFAFGICFTLLMLIWFDQHVFFRRYGMDDTWTIVLNSALIFIVLFFVYPLKFLFTVIFSSSIYGEGKSPFWISGHQVPALMVVYGLGYLVIHILFMLMYLHAYRHRTALQLTRLEIFDTRTKLFAQFILMSVGILSVLLALILPGEQAGKAGYAYTLIGVGLTIHYTVRAGMRKKLWHPNVDKT
jgi:uncharacterized membrane protein